VEMIDEILHTALNPMMKMVGRSLNRRAKETWLTSEQANTLFRQGKITQGLWYETITCFHIDIDMFSVIAYVT
ncbi:unnamed protein product, partial [marine sediment metagenome]